MRAIFLNRDGGSRHAIHIVLKMAAVVQRKHDTNTFLRRHYAVGEIPRKYRSFRESLCLMVALYSTVPSCVQGPCPNQSYSVRPGHTHEHLYQCGKPQPVREEQKTFS